MNYSYPFHVSHRDRNNSSRQPHSRLPKTKGPRHFHSRPNCLRRCPPWNIELLAIRIWSPSTTVASTKDQSWNWILNPQIFSFFFQKSSENSTTSDLYHILYLHQATRLPSCETLAHAPNGASILRGSRERESYDITQLVFTFGLTNTSNRSVCISRVCQKLQYVCRIYSIPAPARTNDKKLSLFTSSNTMTDHRIQMTPP